MGFPPSWDEKLTEMNLRQRIAESADRTDENRGPSSFRVVGLSFGVRPGSLPLARGLKGALTGP